MSFQGYSWLFVLNLEWSRIFFEPCWSGVFRVYLFSTLQSQVMGFLFHFKLRRYLWLLQRRRTEIKILNLCPYCSVQPWPTFMGQRLSKKHLYVLNILYITNSAHQSSDVLIFLSVLYSLGTLYCTHSFFEL